MLMYAQINNKHLSINGSDLFLIIFLFETIYTPYLCFFELVLEMLYLVV